jgi:Fur family ferric uptake transcriptional regulator
MTSDIARRNTRQRSAIHAALAAARRPLLPAEILELAQQTIPELGLATVYRNIKLLLDGGEVQGVELPGAAMRYELAQGHHHHFQCRRCERVFDVPGCPPDLQAFAPAGFVVDGHDLILYGTCAACADRDAYAGACARPTTCARAG